MTSWREFLLSAVLLTAGCAIAPQNPNYVGPPERPSAVEAYYKKTPYTAFTEYTLGHGKKFTVKRILIETASGEVTADYFAQNKKNDSLILVFPLLGGKNIIPDYFASYFAKHGYDTAIIHRTENFKDPAYFDKLEQTLRDNVVRDRIALDFFEKEYDKKNFGSFGISRGAINVAITAGIDPRLKYNVLAMGGSDLVDIFKHANIKKLKKYRDKIIADKGITKDDFYKILQEKIKTDPKYLAQYMDSRNTLLFLSMFDRTVPFKNGELLRKQIGSPRTIFLASDHFTSAMYTQLGRVVPLGTQNALFPFDYIESEALDFYDSKFHKRKYRLGMVPYRILQFPFDVMQRIVGSTL